MKNIIVGVFGGLIFFYTILISLSIYSVQSRKNELKNCLSEIVWQTLDSYYVPVVLREADYEAADEELIEEELIEELERRLRSDSTYSITILACDMDKGILSVRVDERYSLPNGKEKRWHYAKTAIVE
jgi:hypothetical protein